MAKEYWRLLESQYKMLVWIRNNPDFRGYNSLEPFVEHYDFSELGTTYRSRVTDLGHAAIENYELCEALRRITNPHLPDGKDLCDLAREALERIERNA